MAKQRSHQTTGLLYGIASQVLWGSGGVAIKLIDPILPSSLLVGIRHSIGALALGANVLRGNRHLLKGLPIFHLIALGILAAGLPDLLLVEAVRKSGAIVAVMLARIEIPLGVIFAHFILKERVSPRAYWAVLASIIGVGLISYKPGLTISLETDFYIGVALALLTAVLWALSGVYAKYILNKKTDPLALSFVRLTIGSLFAFTLAAIMIEKPLEILKQLSTTDWVLLLYLGLFVSGAAYLFFYRSLKILDAHVAALLLSVSIVVLLILGLAIGEEVHAWQWLGVVFVVLSISLIQQKKPQPDET